MLQIHATRQMKRLTRQGVLVEELGHTQLAEPNIDGEGESYTLRPLKAAIITHRNPFAPHAGRCGANTTR